MAEEQEQGTVVEEQLPAGAPPAEDAKPPSSEQAELPKPDVEASAGDAEHPVDRAAIAAEILADETLSTQDYAQARSDPKHLDKLVDARIEQGKQEKAKPAGQPREEEAKAKPEGDGKDVPGSRRKQAKIDQLTRRTADLEEENRTLREQLEAKETAKAKPAGEAQPATTEEADPEPQEGKFDSWDAYNKAHVKWVAREAAREELDKREKVFREKRDKDAREARQADVKRIWDASVAASQDVHEDYEEIVFENDWPRTRPMVDAMMESEVGGEIAYFLASHREEAERIAGLNPLRAVKEIGKLEDRLTPKKAAAPAKNGNGRRIETSKAPEPITPSGGVNAQTVKDAEYYATKASPQEYEEWRSKGGQ